MHWTILSARGDPRTLDARLGGEPTAADLTAFVVALAARAAATRARGALVDATGLASTRPVRADELRGVAGTVMRDARLSRLRVGVVAPSPDAFGLARLMLSVAAAGSGARVFRSREDATRFLARSIP